MLVAVDTNVLMHLADGVSHVVEAVEVVQKRVRDCRMIATATVIQELAFKATRGETDQEREYAHRTLSETVPQFNITPCNLIPVSHGIVEIIGQKLRDKGLLPYEEKHDAFVLAEAALLGCGMLLTGDSDLKAVSHEQLTMVLNEFDVKTPLIATPREIVQKFLRR